MLWRCHTSEPGWKHSCFPCLTALSKKREFMGSSLLKIEKSGQILTCSIKVKTLFKMKSPVKIRMFLLSLRIIIFTPSLETSYISESERVVGSRLSFWILLIKRWSLQICCFQKVHVSPDIQAIDSSCRVNPWPLHHSFWLCSFWSLEGF